MTEYAETVASLVPVALRRLGQRRIHAALVMPDTVLGASVVGVSCHVAVAPVVSFCWLTLTGTLVVLTDDDVTRAQQQGTMCARCGLWWPHAVAIKRNRHEAGR